MTISSLDASSREDLDEVRAFYERGKAPFIDAGDREWARRERLV
jgi:hypothetical protein